MNGIIDWLDGRIAETAREKANDKDDYALLLDGERLQAYRSARAHMSALHGTANCTIHHLAEMADAELDKWMTARTIGRRERMEEDR